MTFSTGADVVHAWDGYVEQVLQESDLADTLAELIATPGFKNKAIESLRDADLLEEYPRDDSGFVEFVSEVITDNFWELDFVESSTERYDYKRGYCTLEASVDTTVGDVLQNPEYVFRGWSTTVDTDLGRLTLS